MDDIRKITDPVRLHAIIEKLRESKKKLEVQLDLALRDELTGLVRRGRFHEIVEATITHGYIPTSLIFADLNGLKMFNDNYGHEAGDSLLVQFAGFLQDERKVLEQKGVTVVIGRMSGDEFVILLPYYSYDETCALMSVIKERLARRIFYIAGRITRIVAAMGAATIGENCSTALDLLHKADLAMYEDKNEMHNANILTTVLEI